MAATTKSKAEKEREKVQLDKCQVNCQDLISL